MNREKRLNKTMQGTMRTSAQPRPSVLKASAPGPSRSLRRPDSGQQTPGPRQTPEEAAAPLGAKMYRAQKQHVPISTTGRHGFRTRFYGPQLQTLTVAPAAKSPGKQKLLSKRASNDPHHLSPNRTKTPEVQTNAQKWPDIRSPDIPDRMDPKPTTKASVGGETSKDETVQMKTLDQPVPHVVLECKTPKKRALTVEKNSDQHRSRVVVKGHTRKARTAQKKKAAQNVSDGLGRVKAAEDESEVEPRISDRSEDRLNDSIFDAIVNYITSKSFHRQLSNLIMKEIRAKIAKAVLHSRFSTAKEKVQNIFQDLQLSNKSVAQSRTRAKSPARRSQQEHASKHGLSVCIASLVGYKLIESRDQIIESVKGMSPKLPAASSTDTGMVEDVFESILASIFFVDAPNPDEDINICSRESMIKTLASPIVSEACESIFHSLKPKGSPDPVHEPAVGDDEMCRTLAIPASRKGLVAETDVDLEQVSATSLEGNTPSPIDDSMSIPKKIIRKLKNLLTSKDVDQAQSSKPEDEDKDEDGDDEESILDAFIPPPKTSATDQDLKPEEGAEELRVDESDANLEQVLATPSEENVPSEASSQDLQLRGHQEHASPVPSPPPSEKPESPRRSPRRRTYRTALAGSLENMLPSIPDKSDPETSSISQKKEEALKHTLFLSDVTKAVSLESAEREKLKDMLRTDQSSGPEVKGKVEDEEEDILAAFLPPPQTSAVEQDLKPDEGAEKLLVDESGFDLEQVLATPSGKHVPSEATAQDLQMSGHQEHASHVPSPRFSEKPESPRRSTRRRTYRTALAGSLENMLPSIPDKSDPETSSISQKKEEALKHTLFLSDMTKAVSLDSADMEEFKKMLWTDFKKPSLLISKAPDQDQSSGPEVKGKVEDEEEDILAAFLPPPQTSAVEQDLKPDEGAEKLLVDESGFDLEQVLATPSGKHVPSEATAEDLQLSGHQDRANLVPSPRFSEKPESPRRSPRRRTYRTALAGSLENMLPSIPDKSDPETSSISQKKEEALKHTLFLSDVTKAVSLESAEREMLRTDQSSGPELKGKHKDDEKSILDAFIQDLKPEEGDEELPVDESADLQLSEHQEHASPVPSPPSTKRPDATRSKKAIFISTMKKGMKKGSVLFGSKEELKPKVPTAKSSVDEDKEGSSDSLDEKSSVQETTRHVLMRTVAFKDCFKSCTKEQDPEDTAHCEERFEQTL